MTELNLRGALTDHTILYKPYRCHRIIDRNGNLFPIDKAKSIRRKLSQIDRNSSLDSWRSNNLSM